MKSHPFPIRIYYEDTDAGGIVYYANYLKFAERARTELLRECGINQTDLLQAHDIGFVVRRVTCDFLKPAMLDDLLTIKTRIDDISKVSIHMHQAILRGKEELVTLEVKLAVIDSKKRIAKMPSVVLEAMQNFF